MAGQLYSGGAEGASGGDNGKEGGGIEPEGACNDGDARDGVGEGASIEKRKGTELTRAGTAAEDPVMRILATRAGQVDRGDEMWRSRVQRC